MKIFQFFNFIWKQAKDFFTEGFVEAFKGFLTGGSVGSIIDSWDGFIIGIISGSILGAFIGSSLYKIFDWIFEKIHLMLHLKTIEFPLEINDIDSDLASNIEANYILVRYGRDEVINSTQNMNKQALLATKLRNKLIKIGSEYNKGLKKLTITFKMKRHTTHGIQFKLFLTGLTPDEIKPILSDSPLIKEVSAGGGDDTKTYILIEGRTKVFDKKGNGYLINECRTPEGIKNNFIYPK